MADDAVVWSQELWQYLSRLPEEQQEKARLFLAKAPEFLSFLRGVGYDGPAASSAATFNFPFAIQLYHVNRQVDRDLDVGFVRFRDDQPGGEILGVHIAREVHRAGGTRSWGACLTPEVYLEHYHPQYDLSKLDLRSYEGRFEERLENRGH